jgi:molybdopterin-guanine dinucleotide biosynthesis protein A
MGCDKAWLDLGGRPLIEHVIAALAPAVAKLAIIANSDRYRRLGYPVYPDENTGVGPLEAIRVALTNCESEYAVLVGCDLPFVTTGLFETLFDLGQGFDAIVPDSSAGHLEPLCALYSVQALPSLTGMIRAGHRKTSDLLDHVRTRVVSFGEIEHLTGSALFFTNVNTPDDYDRALILTGGSR